MDDLVNVKLYSDKSIKEISGNENFVVAQLEINRISNNQDKDNKCIEKFFGFLNKWGPERFPRLIYSFLTNIRGFVFYLLALFFVIAFFVDFEFSYPFHFGIDTFQEWSTKMMYLLFAIGAFNTTTFFKTVNEVVQRKQEARQVTTIWTNLVKYTLYPFGAGIVIASILFLGNIGQNINALFPLFLLFVFLTINSFYTTIRMAQILIDENYLGE